MPGTRCKGLGREAGLRSWGGAVGCYGPISCHWQEPLPPYFPACRSWHPPQKPVIQRWPKSQYESSYSWPPEICQGEVHTPTWQCRIVVKTVSPEVWLWVQIENSVCHLLNTQQTLLMITALRSFTDCIYLFIYLLWLILLHCSLALQPPLLRA
jgi:hypothetical protein